MTGFAVLGYTSLDNNKWYMKKMCKICHVLAPNLGAQNK